MCTVTFIARRRGYCLGMNRDEKLARPTGLPPTKKIMDGRAVISPSEPGGGTWITLNDHGVALALINWYSITARVGGKAMSRGEVVNTASAAISPGLVDATLHKLPLNRINPFRLIGIYPATSEIVEWRWNLKQLVRKNHHWKAQQWISSGFDEPAAQRSRGKTFRQAQKQNSAGSLDWLRRLHRSHAPETGPYSTCMHRADAATVSYTEMFVSPREAVVRYFAGPPCRNLEHSLPFIKCDGTRPSRSVVSTQLTLVQQSLRNDAFIPNGLVAAGPEAPNKIIHQRIEKVSPVYVGFFGGDLV